MLVRTLEVGVCGTDREISEGLFGSRLRASRCSCSATRRSPSSSETATASRAVSSSPRQSAARAAMHRVRRGLARLVSDRRLQRARDHRLHGYDRELVAEDPKQLIAIPKSLGRLGVLAEPTSICERALRHARTIGGRQPWQLERALVIGAGAIGLLTTYLLRLADVEVWTASLEPENELVEQSGARYASTHDTELSRARDVRPRDRSGRQRADDGADARPAPPERRRVPARDRSA